MPRSCKKNAAFDSRSANIATKTFAPVTSVRPDDCTWINARWITRWNAAVGAASAPSISVIKDVKSSSRYSTNVSRNDGMLTSHASRTRSASGSSKSASNKCSSVANSCCLSFASASEECIACSSVGENEGIAALLSMLDRHSASSCIL
jgi:hypothetical protein